MIPADVTPLIDMATLERIAPVIRIAAHPLRLRIVDFLHHGNDPRTVTDIVDATGAGQAIVSHQLRILRDQGIVAACRKGNHVLYEISNHSVLLLLECIRRQQGGCSASQ